MKIKNRIQFLLRLAQEEKKALQANTFLATSKFPYLLTSFKSSGAVDIINKLSDYLNKAVFYSSDGEMDMLMLINKKFIISASDPSIASNKDLKSLVLFSKDIYSTIFNNGVAFTEPVDKEKFLSIISTLRKSSALSSLSQTNPSSELGKKMGGDIKSNILSLINNLAAVAPTA